MVCKGSGVGYEDDDDERGNLTHSHFTEARRNHDGYDEDATCHTYIPTYL